MDDAAKITCPNCQAVNLEINRFCQQCGTLVPKGYLSAFGKGIEAVREGQLLAERYLVKRVANASINESPIVLDTKPGFLPEFPAEIPGAVAPYLRLFPYQIHVPQVYGMVTLEKKGGKYEEIWLLEQVPIYWEQQQAAAKLQFLPQLSRVWQNASPLRQLNWLWQIAMLWQPFSSEGVATSLLNPSLLRVEGSLVRLLELQIDRSTPSLNDLGQFWRHLVAEAKPIVAEFLQQLCQQMIDSQVESESLVAELDQALAHLERQCDRTSQIVTRTDTGPSRQRNEDSCYPPEGNLNSFEFSAANPANPTPFAVVCDGIGGHEGGSVASNLAIVTIIQQLEELKNNASWTPETLSNQLELAVCSANDQIALRNDAEQRQQRQRMGTTLVMALAHGHEVYITHVGDSRAYLISRTSCHQVTLDDDVASREVRLGYAIYREALQQIGSGSLVQALGMGSSMNLHPTVQRFVVDEDCIFLLCSDGLSDSDRVEQFWEEEIRPVLDGKVDLATAAARLVEIGNTLNGHDNVTVGLVYCQVKTKQENLVSKLWGRKSASPAYTPKPTLTAQRPDAANARSAPTLQKTQLLQTPRRTKSLLPLLFAIPLLLGLGGVLAYLLVPEIGQKVYSVFSKTSPSPAATPSSPVASPSLNPGTFVIVKSAAEIASGEIRDLVLLPEPVTSTRRSATVPGQQTVIAGSILQVMSKQATPGQPVWVRLKVCSTPANPSAQTPEPQSQPIQERQEAQKKPTPTNPSPTALSSREASLKPTPTLLSGEIGWIRETDLGLFALPTSTVAPAQQGKCATASG